MARAEQRAPHFYQSALRCGNPRIEVLIELSRDLNHNLLHLHLLPTNFHPAPAQEVLRMELDARRSELERLRQENAKLWAVVVGRAG